MIAEHGIHAMRRSKPLQRGLQHPRVGVMAHKIAGDGYQIGLALGDPPHGAAGVAHGEGPAQMEIAELGDTKAVECGR